MTFQPPPTPASAIPWAGLSRILVVRLDNLGDVVMLSPALRAISEAAPGASITLLASPGGARAASLLPEISSVIEHRASWQERSGREVGPFVELELIERLRGHAFDAAVVFTSFSQDAGPAAYACCLAGIPIRAGWAPLFNGAVLTHPVTPPAPEGHQVVRNLELVQALGASPSSSRLRLRIPGHAAAAARSRLRELGLDSGGYVALLPGASAPARRYPPERFAQVALELASDPGLPSLVIGDERDRPLAEAILRATAGAVRSAAGSTDVATAAALVAGARLVVANNSLGLHLADAFGVPLVVAFAGTDLESQWAPRTTPARLFRRPTDCAPCYGIVCSRALECLDIGATELARAGRRLLATQSPAA